VLEGARVIMRLHVQRRSRASLGLISRALVSETIDHVGSIDSDRRVSLGRALALRATARATISGAPLRCVPSRTYYRQYNHFYVPGELIRRICEKLVTSFQFRGLAKEVDRPPLPPNERAGAHVFRRAAAINTQSLTAGTNDC